jgi:RNA polymerase sigma-70 factor (ECF subfamily)
LEDTGGHDTTSASLLVRVRDPEDQAAWREFVARYAELILRYCRGRGLRPADCEDVRQLVLLNLANGLRHFEYDPKAGRFRNYLGRIVRNSISRHFVRKEPANAALDTNVLAKTPDDDDAQDQQWEEEWVNHHYRLAMQTIRETFEPRSVEVFNGLLAGDRTEVLASHHGLTRQAVHQVKHRIQTRMRELIARQIREEDEPDVRWK